MKAMELGTGAAARAESRPIKWAIFVIVFFLGNVLLWADRSNFSIAAAVWAKEYKWAPSTIGTMLSAFSLGYLVMQPIGGWIADRIGSSRTLAVTMAGWSLWVLLTPIAPAILWLTATFRVLLGICEAPYIPASAAAIAKAVPSNHYRGRYSAFMQSGAQLGPAVGVFLAGLILGATGAPAMIFILFGGFGLLAAAGWWLFTRHKFDPVPTGVHAQTVEAKDRAAQVAVPQMKLVTSKRLWPIYIGYFALPYCQYIFLTWLPIYLTQYRHIPLLQASVLSTYPFLVAFVASNFAGWVMDWMSSLGFNKGAIHRKLFIGLGALIYAVTMYVAATTESTSLAVYMIIIANAGLAFYVQPYWTMCTDIAPKQSGALTGLMNGCGILGATISPFVSGVIAQETGAFVAPLELAAAIMVIAATTAIIFIRVRPIGELVG
ncbi:MAG TPA: MFS transporter [Stellaceae bacterium]|nr:MFS transporter [Stellaceae bacterium]